MTTKEFIEECNKEIRRYLQEADEKYETEEKERICARYTPENDIELIIKAIEVYKMLYDSTPKEWGDCVKRYEDSPEGSILRHIDKLFHLIHDMEYETKKEAFYQLYKIVGGM